MVRHFLISYDNTLLLVRGVSTSLLYFSWFICLSQIACSKCLCVHMNFILNARKLEGEMRHTLYCNMSPRIYHIIHFANIIALLCINYQILCLWIHRYEFFGKGRVWLFLYLSFFLDRLIEPLNWFFRGQGFRLFLLILLSKHSKHNYQDFLFPAIRFMPINNFASAGNRTRIYCLGSNNANHYTTNALMTWH